MSFKTHSIFLLLVAVVAGCSGSNGTPDPAPGSDPATNPTTIPDGNRAAAIIAAFSGVLEDRNITSGSLAVSYNGEIIDTFGKQREPTEAAGLASLSKSIMALCSVAALDEFGGTPDQTLGEIMPDRLNEFPDRDTRFDQVTVSQLITHTSGLHGNHVLASIPLVTSTTEAQSELQFKVIVELGMDADPGSDHFYNNSNYLVLGLVVENVTSQDYESYCHQKLLQPLGITTARVMPRWRVIGPFGGWEMSVVDYLNYLNAYYKTEEIFGKPAEGISATTSSDTRYGLGTLMRKTSLGRIYWHAGSWNGGDVAAIDDFGAYFISFDNGYAVVVNVDTNIVENGILEDIDMALFTAAKL